MSIPPSIVYAARKSWGWQWNQLMKGLAPADKDGNFKRVPSQKTNAELPETENLFHREKHDLPTLIIGRSCPWAHRTWLVYEIRELKNSLNLIFAKADSQRGQWLLEPSFLGCNSLLEIYNLCDTAPLYRPTVPVLIDPKPNKQRKPKILGNESAQLIEVLNQWPSKGSVPNLLPERFKDELDELSEILQEKINDGVYKCGFARNQEAYEMAVDQLFNALKIIENKLTLKGPWLCGEELTLADIKLFPTLIRWECVYSPLFRCSKEPLWTFPKIWEWRKQFFNLYTVSKTCNSSNWRNDYFGALFPLNPSNIIPKGPSLGKIVNSCVFKNNV